MKYLLLLILFIFTVIGLNQFISRSKLIGCLIILVTCFGIYLVIYPDNSTYIATLMGVGRGADLLLYSLFIVMVLVCYVLYVNFYKSNQYLTKLARKIALLDIQKK